MPKPTRVDYCQYLLSTPVNYTLTHFADHSESFSHDQINRYLAKDRLTPRQVWEHVEPDVIQTCDGYVIFDDTTVEKPSASEIPLAKPQYSGPRSESRQWHRYRDVCLCQSGVRPVLVDRLSHLR